MPVPGPEHVRRLAAQHFIQQATDLLHLMMAEQDRSISSLAIALQRSRSSMSQILNGHRTLTLAVLAEAAHELGYELEIDFKVRSS